MHHIYKQFTYQCYVILPYKSLFHNNICEIYEHHHYNQINPNVRQNQVDCPFCHLANTVELVSETATAVAFYDIFPVSKGHTLIIPKRHVDNYFDLSTREQRALWLLANRCKNLLTKRFNPDGFNVGINVHFSNHV
jgi:galactose-1-phosphate uridylyltransferase